MIPRPPFKRTLPVGTLLRFEGILRGAGACVGGRGVRVGGRRVWVGKGVQLGTGVLLKVSVGRGVAVGIVGVGVGVKLGNGVIETTGNGGSKVSFIILTACAAGMGVLLGSRVGSGATGTGPQAPKLNMIKKLLIHRLSVLPCFWRRF